MAGATAQKVAAAHVGKQANIGFRHRHLGTLGDDTHTRALADAHAAAHHHAIHEGDVRFGIGLDQVVEGVFLGEKVFQCGITRECGLMEKTNISACTKTAKKALRRSRTTDFIGSANRDDQDRWVVTPGTQDIEQCAHHLQRQGIKGFGAVQRDQPGTAASLGEHIRCGLVLFHISRHCFCRHGLCLRPIH